MIRNRTALLDHGRVEDRRTLLDIAEEAIDRVHPDVVVPGTVRIEGDELIVDGETYELDSVGDLYVFGAGKGSLATVSALVEVLDGLVSRAIAVEKRGQAETSDDIEVYESGHPIPDEAGLQASESIVDMLESAGPDDLVFACINGGASAQLPYPVEDISLADLVELTDSMLSAGLPIDEINTVRKHLSKIKGGRLAEIIHPARSISLIVVDEVAGEPWGPTVPDETSFADAIDVLKTRNLWAAAPASVRQYLESGLENPAMETPGPDAFDRYRTQPVVLTDASDLCEAAKAGAEARKLSAMILSSLMEGESREIARAHAGVAKEVSRYARPIAPPCLIVSGGETTVSVGDDPGRGGPNQEFAVQFAREIDAWSGITALSLGTDGTDGPTELAGGLVDSETASRAQERSIDLFDALQVHDTTPALEELHDAVRTGGTGTNLMDLRLVAVTDAQPR